MKRACQWISPVVAFVLRIVILLAVPILAMAENGAADGDSYSALPVQSQMEAVSNQPEGPGNDPHGPEQKEDWTFSVGAATIFKPAFTGSKDYQAMLVPDFKIEYKDEFFASLFGIGYNVINHDGWRAGPIVKLDFGRTEDDDNPFRIAGKKTEALKGLGDVDATLELGGFVEYEYDKFSCTLELRQGVGGHEGLVGETGLNFKDTANFIGRSVMYAIGPRAMFASSNYNNTYFGISSSQSARSGLAKYDADGGLVSYGMGMFAATPISDSLSLGFFGSYERLTGDAADSPLITERGDRNQFMSGISISYEFGYSPE